MSRSGWIGLLAGVTLCGGAAQASWVMLDDFDGHTPGTALGGPNWSPISTPDYPAEPLIATGGAATSEGTERAYMIYQNPDNLMLENKIRFTVEHGTYASQWVGGIVGYNDVTGKFIQVRLVSTSNTLGFTSVFFYNEDESPWAGMGESPATQFSTSPGIASMEVTIELLGETVTVSLDWEGDETPEFTTSRSGVPTAQLGNGIGIAAYMNSTNSDPAKRPRIDNAQGYVVPDPASTLLLLAGAGALSLGRRRRNRRGH